MSDSHETLTCIEAGILAAQVRNFSNDIPVAIVLNQPFLCCGFSLDSRAGSASPKAKLEKRVQSLLAAGFMLRPAACCLQLPRIVLNLRSTEDNDPKVVSLCLFSQAQNEGNNSTPGDILNVALGCNDGMGNKAGESHEEPNRNVYRNVNRCRSRSPTLPAYFTDSTGLYHVYIHIVYMYMYTYICIYLFIYLFVQNNSRRPCELAVERIRSDCRQGLRCLRTSLWRASS